MKLLEDCSNYRSSLANILNNNLFSSSINETSWCITGSTGLLGSSLIDLLLCARLEFGYHVDIVAIGRSELSFRGRFGEYANYCTFISQDVIEEFDRVPAADYVIHAAANSFPALFVNDPVGTLRSGFLGTLNALNYAARNKCCRFLYVSSGEVYGNRAFGEDRSFLESDQGLLDLSLSRSCYPASKQVSEVLCTGFSDQFDIDCVIARPCHLYGPAITSSDNRATAQFLRQAMSGSAIVLKSFGDQERSWLHSLDCASALIFLELHPSASGPYNIAPSKCDVDSIAGFAQRVAGCSDSRVVFDFEDREANRQKTNIEKAVLDPSKLFNLGWKPYFTLGSGIQNVFDVLKEKVEDARRA